MFCPKCRSEYVEGTEECFDCKTPLVEKLPPEPRPQTGTRLKYATLLVILGISYIFVLRLIGTFYLDLFRILLVTQISQILSFLASLTMAFFFISFYNDYLGKEQSRLKNATVLAIIGSCALILVDIKSLFLVFSKFGPASPFGSHYIGTVIPWASSTSILIFFVVFYKETLKKEQLKLRKPALFAIIGSSIGTLLITIVLLNFLYSGKVLFSIELFRKVIILIVPVFTFSFISILYFFSSFYKELKTRIK